MRRVLLVLVVLAGCASAPPRVSLGDQWPAATRSWSEARKRWTRHASHFRDWSRTIDAHATLASADWRAAYVAERARRLRLPPEEVTRLAEAQKTAAAEVWEVELIVSTEENDWNDFRKYPNSMWRLALKGDDDREVTPISVAEDRRRRDEIAAYFPEMEPFFSAYVVRFPKSTPDGRPIAGRRLTLKVSGPLGAIEMLWSE